MTSAATHPFSAEELMAFCDGELSPMERQALETHLAACRECAGEVRQFRETSRSLAQWNAPPVSKLVEESVEEQLRLAVFGRSGRKRLTSPGRARAWRWRPWAIGASIAAAALLLVVIGDSVSYKPARSSAFVYEGALQPDDSRPRGGGGGMGMGSPAPDYAENPDQKSAAGAMMTHYALTDSLEANPASAPAPPASPSQSSPMIARSVSFLIVAKDISASRSALDTILARYHGYAADITVSTPADDSPSLKASLRIPVANLDPAMRDLRGLGRVASESESGEDVTQQHADLDQRLKTARVTEERFRAILEQRTGNVSDVLQVEEGIARVRGEIESMEAEQTNLEHRVDFASIDLSVSEEYSAVTGAAPLSVRVRNAFVAGYRNAVGTIVGIFLFLVTYGLAILIWIAILAVPVILLRRRYRRIHAKL